MSFVSTTSLHTVTVLEPNIQIGTSAGAKFNYAPANPPVQYPCRVVPISGLERIQLLENGAQAPHRVHFNIEPVAIDESKWLRWDRPGKRSTILRVMSVPYDASGLGRHFICTADSRREDNQKPGLIA